MDGLRAGTSSLTGILSCSRPHLVTTRSQAEHTPADARSQHAIRRTRWRMCVCMPCMCSGVGACAPHVSHRTTVQNRAVSLMTVTAALVHRAGHINTRGSSLPRCILHVYLCCFKATPYTAWNPRAISKFHDVLTMIHSPCDVLLRATAP